MAGIDSVLWTADPHTIAKIAILKGYLNAWFPIVGSRFKKLVYVDGFSGPGSYKNHREGSPLAALSVFNSWIAKVPERISIEQVRAYFIESDRRRFDCLEEKLKSVPRAKRVSATALHGEFEVVLSDLVQQQEHAENVAGGQPLLIFADPFGGTGIPFHLFKQCLESQGSELILNFDADGIARIHAGRNAGWEAQLDQVFGCNDWQAVFGQPTESLVRQAEKALALYKRQLLAIDGVKFVWSFEMRGKTDRINYYLVFASRNRLGMEKMKEAMRSIDGSGNYCFSDAYHDQHILFKNDDAEFFAKLLHARYRGQAVTYGELDHYALCDTPFTNPKGMLEWLSRNEWIRARPVAGSVLRAHTFPEDRVAEIVFLDPPIKQVQSTLF